MREKARAVVDVNTVADVYYAHDKMACPLNPLYGLRVVAAGPEIEGTAVAKRSYSMRCPHNPEPIRGHTLYVRLRTLNVNPPHPPTLLTKMGEGVGAWAQTYI